MKALGAIIRKDLKLFFNNPKAVIITMLVPIVIGAFMGSLTGGGGGGKAQRVSVCVVNQDEGPVAAEIMASIQKDESLKTLIATEAEARDLVLNGKVGVAVIFPPGFGDAASRSMFGPRAKPKLTLLHDPSKTMEIGMVGGLLSKNIMQIVGKNSFGGPGGSKMIKESLGELSQLPATEENKQLVEMLQGLEKYMSRPAAQGANGAGASPLAQGFSVPYETVNESVLRKKEAQYNGYAHSFAGMAVQFVLMFAIETGIALLLDRKRGLWSRLRSAPLSKSTVLGGRALSSAVISLLTLFVCWAFCIAFFGVRIHGSLIAFILCNISFALFAASVGLFIAAIGRNPEAARGISIFAILILVMLGGAWVPSFVFPEWLQNVTLFIPTRWAVDGFDGATWRGLSFTATLLPSAVLLGYTLVFALLANWKFKWDES